jgi:hypothetical protein
MISLPLSPLDHSTERILAGYPGIDGEKVELATIRYAEANPARGRPCRTGELPKSTTIVSNRRSLARK